MVKSFQDKKRPKKVVNKEDNKSKPKPKTSSNGFYYSFLTVILLLCLVQIAISAILNVSKVISYKSKIVQIEKTRDVALTLNEQLKENIKNFSNASGLEAIARNNLKMAGKDEILIILNTTKDEKVEKPQKMGFIKHD